MALCDRLEATQGERAMRRDRVVAASLQRLNEPTKTLKLDACFGRRHGLPIALRDSVVRGIDRVDPLNEFQ
jgi:hypothetical protein